MQRKIMSYYNLWQSTYNVTTQAVCRQNKKRAAHTRVTLPLYIYAASLAHVSGPTIPSAASPLACWNAITAALVFGPKV